MIIRSIFPKLAYATFPQRMAAPPLTLIAKRTFSTEVNNDPSTRANNKNYSFLKGLLVGSSFMAASTIFYSLIKKDNKIDNVPATPAINYFPTEEERLVEEATKSIADYIFSCPEINQHVPPSQWKELQSHMHSHVKDYINYAFTKRTSICLSASQLLVFIKFEHYCPEVRYFSRTNKITFYFSTSKLTVLMTLRG